jgi:hypothetical protein
MGRTVTAMLVVRAQAAMNRASDVAARVQRTMKPMKMKKWWAVGCEHSSNGAHCK